MLQVYYLKFYLWRYVMVLKVCRQPYFLSNGDSLTQPGRKASGKRWMSSSSQHLASKNELGASIVWQFPDSFDFSAYFILILDKQMFNTIITSNSIYSDLILPPSENLHTTVVTLRTQGLVSKTSTQGDNCL